jgi:hypothetical protein
MEQDGDNILWAMIKSRRRRWLEHIGGEKCVQIFNQKIRRKA